MKTIGTSRRLNDYSMVGVLVISGLAEAHTASTIVLWDFHNINTLGSLVCVLWLAICGAADIRTQFMTI